MVYEHNEANKSQEPRAKSQEPRAYSQLTANFLIETTRWLIIIVAMHILVFTFGIAQVRIKEKIVLQKSHLPYPQIAAVSSLKFVVNVSVGRVGLGVNGGSIWGDGHVEWSEDNPVDGTTYQYTYIVDAGELVPTNHLEIYVDGILVESHITYGSGIHPNYDECPFPCPPGLFGLDRTPELDHFFVTAEPQTITHLNQPSPTTQENITSAVLNVTPINIYNIPFTMGETTPLVFTLDSEGSQLGNYRKTGVPDATIMAATLGEVNSGAMSFVANGQLAEGVATINVTGQDKSGSGIVKVIKCGENLPSCANQPIDFTIDVTSATGTAGDNNGECGERGIAGKTYVTSQSASKQVFPDVNQNLCYDNTSNCIRWQISNVSLKVVSGVCVTYLESRPTNDGGPLIQINDQTNFNSELACDVIKKLTPLIEELQDSKRKDLAVSRDTYFYYESIKKHEASHIQQDVAEFRNVLIFANDMSKDFLCIDPNRVSCDENTLQQIMRAEDFKTFIKKRWKTLNDENYRADELAAQNVEARELKKFLGQLEISFSDCQ